MRLKQFVRMALFILALSFLTESLGYLTHELYRYSGAALLVFYGLSVFPFGAKTERVGLFCAGWLLLALSFFFLGGSILSRLAGTALFIFALGCLAQSKGAEQLELPVLLAATVLTYAFSLLYLYSPPFWFWLKEVSLLFSTAVSRLSGIPVLFSSTFLGVTISFIFLAVMLLIFFYYGRRKPRLLFLSLPALPVLNGLYLIIIGCIPRAGEVLMAVFPEETGFFGRLLLFLFEKESPLAHYNYQMYAPILLFFFYLLPLAVVCRAGGVAAAGPRSGRGKKRKAGAPFGAWRTRRSSPTNDQQGDCN